MWIAALLMAWYFINIVKFIKELIKFLFSIFAQIWKIIYLKFIQKKYNNNKEVNKYHKQEKMKEKMKEAKKQEKYRQKQLKEETKVIKAGLKKVRQLKMKFPYAKQKLFDNYLEQFPILNLDELKDIEDKIKQSHENNINDNFQDNNKKYTLEDLNDKEAIEEHKEKPLVMKVYKIDNVYILYYRDLDRDNISLLQASKYLPIARTIARVKRKQRELKKRKEKIKAQQIRSIYNDELDIANEINNNRNNFSNE
jgi:type III secretory pathway component EscV